MNIFTPKYKDIHVRDGNITIPASKVAGRFRCILQRSDGSIKLQTPWQDNLVTNVGTERLRYLGDWGGRILIGTGVAAPAITDTQLGTQIANIPNNDAPIDNTNSGTPLYMRTVTRQSVYVPGVGTGTITELGLSHESTAAPNQANTRQLLTVPIVKGPSDQLTIQYQVMMYPFTGDVTGVINISGVDYDYTIRGSNLQHVPHNDNAPFPDFNMMPNRDMYRVFDGSIGTITGYPAGANVGAPEFQPSTSYGGSLGNYYSDVQMVFGVDNSLNTKVFKSCWCGMNWGAWLGSYATNPGWQFEIGKVSDGTGLLKENTHQLVMSVRCYSDRY